MRDYNAVFCGEGSRRTIVLLTSQAFVPGWLFHSNPVDASGRRHTPPWKRTGLKRLCLLACLSSTVALGETWQPGTLTIEETRRLEAGDVLVTTAPARTGGGEISAVIDIAAPPRCLMAIMRDCESAPNFIEGLQSCRVLSRSADGGSDVREHVVKWLWFLSATRSVFRSEYEGASAIRFQRVSGDLRALDGSWDLLPVRDGRATRLFYRAHVDPGIPLPDAIVRSALEFALPKTLRALRTEGERRRDRCQ
jgi:ribosome-associated toxin RatA of RatAB toxin-antitoxin module